MYAIIACFLILFLVSKKQRIPTFYVGILVISVSFVFIRWQSYEDFAI